MERNKDVDVKSLTMDELKLEMEKIGEKAFRAKQLYEWMHVKLARSYDEMTNIPKNLRERLVRDYPYTALEEVTVQVSKTDGTRKYLFALSDGNYVESVWMQYHHGNSVCISSQVGCRMGCRFCMTGRQGFHGHMSAADIISQMLAVDESDRLTNVVFMGMGEPLDNYDNVIRAIEIMTADWGFGWSPKRITVSTIGVLPSLKRFLDESRCHLAVSMHNPFPDERLEIMPVQKAYPIDKVVDLIRQYDFTGQRRVSFEYTMFSGFNDTKRHADAVARMLSGLECRVNLIRFHQIPDFPYRTSPDGVIELFKERLSRAGIITTVRASRGEDIFAACGMLAGKHKEKEQ